VVGSSPSTKFAVDGGSRVRYIALIAKVLLPIPSTEPLSIVLSLLPMTPTLVVISHYEAHLRPIHGKG
jgi:hypothetical protein